MTADSYIISYFFVWLDRPQLVLSDCRSSTPYNANGFPKFQKFREIFPSSFGSPTPNMKYSGSSAAVRPYLTIHRRAIGRDGSPCRESFRAIIRQIVTGPCDFQADLNGGEPPLQSLQRRAHPLLLSAGVHRARGSNDSPVCP